MKAAEVIARVEALEAEVARLRRTHGAKYLATEDAAAYIGVKLETFRFYVHRQRLFTKYRHGAGRGRHAPLAFAIAELDAYMTARRDKSGDRLKTVRLA